MATSAKNTSAKKGTGRGAAHARAPALRVPFGIVAPSSVKPEVFPPDDFYGGPPVASVKALRPTLLRQIFDAELWLRAFERSGGRFGRRRRPSSAETVVDDDDIAADEEEEEEDEQEVDETAEQEEVEEEENVNEEEEEGKGEAVEQYGDDDAPRFNSAKLKQLRQIVQIGTIDAVLRGKYFVADRPPPGEQPVVREVHLNRKAMQRAASATKRYESDHVYALDVAKGGDDEASGGGNGDDEGDDNDEDDEEDDNGRRRHKKQSNKKKEKKEVMKKKMMMKKKKRSAKRRSREETDRRRTTQMLVVEGDCLEAALILQSARGLRPAVLNMASRSNPCGGYRHGTAAQEENLTRRSNLFQCLEDPYRNDPGRQWSYPLPEFGGLYSPDVTVFRRSEAAGYAFMEQPRQVSVVSVAAYSNPPVEEVDGELRLSGHAIIANFKRKIAAILSIALDNGHDSIVLGAFGCGVFGNPPKHIAQLFSEVLRSDRFVPDSFIALDGRFEMVVFAIIDGQNTFQWFNPQGNVQPFAQVFKCEALTLDQLAQRLAPEDQPGQEPETKDQPVEEEEKISSDIG